MLVQDPFSDPEVAVLTWNHNAKYSFSPVISARLILFLSQTSHFMSRILSQKLTKKSNFLNRDRVGRHPQNQLLNQMH